MSYHEENGQVILTMSREDYEWLLQVFAIATVAYMALWHQLPSCGSAGPSQPAQPDLHPVPGGAT